MRKVVLIFILNGFFCLIIATTVFAQTASVFYRSGYRYSEEREYQKAVIEYTKAIEADKAYKEAYLARGLTYDQMNHFQKSVEGYTMMLALESNSPNGLNNRGMTYSFHFFQEI